MARKAHADAAQVTRCSSQQRVHRTKVQRIVRAGFAHVGRHLEGRRSSDNTKDAKQERGEKYSHAKASRLFV